MRHQKVDQSGPESNSSEGVLYTLNISRYSLMPYPLSSGIDCFAGLLELTMMAYNSWMLHDIFSWCVCGERKRETGVARDHLRPVLIFLDSLDED